MVALQLIAYPRLSFNVTQNNHQRIYTSVKKERLWLKRQRFTDESTVVCIVLLKCFQRLGYFPNVTDIPPLIDSQYWRCFYNNGMIQENLRYAQDKISAYDHLVANLVILHNVDSMSKAINNLKRQGSKVDAEALRSLSPFQTEHINLLGTYSLKIPKQQGKRSFRPM